ncbi:unnamed protein product [Coffea canephora]|uniref:DH200=94 genomic scaffold, scaffold_404 n=1 Tax=Coffea canephora TaxID=49390 RepID=A0A068VEY8_COFCA|nr:unnamed protein product [Coffea canephora]
MFSSHHFSFLLLPSTCNLLSISCYGNTSSNVCCNQLDSNSSLSISKNITSSTPLNWNVSADCCFREDVGCDRNGQVNCIWLASRNLEGTISTSIKSLSHLKELNFAHNKLSDLFLMIYIMCQHLQEFSLPGYGISGHVSEAIGDLSNLKIVELYGNNLTGAIPREIRRLSNLEQLFLHVNKLNGTIPSTPMNCTRLIKLNLRVNLLTRELSALNFSKLLQLRKIDLSNSHFVGPISNWAGTLPSLFYLDLSLNFLWGRLPISLSRLPLAIYLNGNNLTGTIPVGIGELHVLDLSHNNFTGSIPETVSHLINLEKLSFSDNTLFGEIPSSFKKLHFLSSFSVANNDLRLNTHWRSA